MSEDIENILNWLTTLNQDLDRIDKRISELFARDLQLRKIVRFWISKYPLKERIIMDLLDDKEGLCFFELPRGEK